MIQVIDGFLAAASAAGASRGRRTSRPGSRNGFFGLNWVRHAAAQARNIHPDATVVWIGPNEGFPIGGARCCGPPGSARTPRGRAR